VRIAFVLALIAIPYHVFAQTKEVIEVTATRIAEDVTMVPASVTIIDGDDIRARNANDLQSALSLVGGVSIAPGGDAGPAGSVPELWGLREFDAFLLVVDGVPWGGAFNPDLTTLSMQNIDRIEIVRGAAPVMYGATSFVGVIHVIHRIAGAPGSGHVTLGNYSSGGASVSVPLSQSPKIRQSLNFDFEKRGFRDKGTSFDRPHLLYRLASDVAGGTLRFDGDVTVLRQKPASPSLTITPLDANYNPSNGKLDQNRYHGAIGFDTKAWSTTLALTRSNHDIVRGFLTDDGATGFQQDRAVTDVYFDTHVVRQLSEALRLIGGFDHLYGRGRADSGLFHYFVPLSGVGRPHSPEPNEETHLIDRRNFSGLYGSTEWSASPALRFDAGVRLNRTTENQRGEDADGVRRDSRTFTRLSGSVGANWQFWSRGRDLMALYADYRNTFKPAAVDFGPEAEGEILDPETAHSVEVGIKGRSLGSKLSWDVSTFQMDFSNLVVSTLRDGQPALESAGRERFRGVDVDLDYGLLEELHWELGYSYHDARFRDYVQNFDGTTSQLAGKRLEMSPFNLLGTGITYSPRNGFNANAVVNYVGSRYLNRRNTSLAAAYTTWSGGVGYRFGRGEVRVDGRNLNDVRPPIAESELGDGQFYRLPARSWEVSYRMNF
jgi:iron complex outermembrane recepter protein